MTSYASNYFTKTLDVALKGITLPLRGPALHW